MSLNTILFLPHRFTQKTLNVNLVLSAINPTRIFPALTNTYGRFSRITRTVALLMHNDSAGGGTTS